MFCVLCVEIARLNSIIQNGIYPNISSIIHWLMAAANDLLASVLTIISVLLLLLMMAILLSMKRWNLFFYGVTYKDMGGQERWTTTYSRVSCKIYEPQRDYHRNCTRTHIHTHTQYLSILHLKWKLKIWEQFCQSTHSDCMQWERDVTLFAHTFLYENYLRPRQRD